jgi:hypothetical protein
VSITPTRFDGQDNLESNGVAAAELSAKALREHLTSSLPWLAAMVPKSSNEVMP